MRYPPPPFRPLRTYAFEPTLSSSLEQAIDNEVTLRVPWEEDLRPGPVGSSVEVIDFDSANECFYVPVDLNSPAVLGQAGLPPSEGVPQFHQQSVYAVVLSTIRQFERGLGRPILWAPRTIEQANPEPREEFVQRLRVYPHALSSSQAFYSPARKAILLGYYPVETASATGSPVRATAFTCLSHGIVVHETVHAILDGLGRAVSLEDSGAEELAVQEAVADLAGLLQQFTIPGFLRGHVAFTSDADENQRLLEGLARRLAQTTGVQSELRKQIGASPARSEHVSPRGLKFQDRASLLVAAVFDAFAVVWRRRCARLPGLGGAASIGRASTGNLLDALAAEAERTASHMLRICIRGLDYCPPVDVTVADYLRALVTADTDVFPEDDRRYRVALMESCRRLGLYAFESAARSPLPVPSRPVVSGIVPGKALEFILESASSREKEFQQEKLRRDRLQAEWLRGSTNGVTPKEAREMGLALGKDAPRTIARTNGLPQVRVGSVRLARRVGSDGRIVTDWIVTVIQSRRGYFDPAVQEAQDAGEAEERADFIFRGGCTLVVDAGTGQARFGAVKDILASDRLARHRESAQQRMPAIAARGDERYDAEEPFAALRGRSVGAV
jgi:hypothetical protein